MKLSYFLHSIGKVESDLEVNLITSLDESLAAVKQNSYALKYVLKDTFEKDAESNAGELKINIMNNTEDHIVIFINGNKYEAKPV